MISIVLVDDQQLMLDGIRTMVNMQPDMRVVGVAASGELAMALVEEHRPDLILMDIEMPAMDGLECTRRIKLKYPDSKIIMLTTFTEDEYVMESLSQGADGFLLKSFTGELLIRSIRDAMDGQLILPAFLASRIVTLLKLSRTSESARLNAARLKEEGIVLLPREREVAELLIQGRSNRHIASQLYMSEGTVRNYISGIYNKLGAKNREQSIEILSSFMQTGIQRGD